MTSQRSCKNLKREDKYSKSKIQWDGSSHRNLLVRFQCYVRRQGQGAAAVIANQSSVFSVVWPRIEQQLLSLNSSLFSASCPAPRGQRLSLLINPPFSVLCLAARGQQLLSQINSFVFSGMSGSHLIANCSSAFRVMTGLRWQQLSLLIYLRFQ